MSSTQNEVDSRTSRELIGTPQNTNHFTKMVEGFADPAVLKRGLIGRHDAGRTRASVADEKGALMLDPLAESNIKPVVIPDQVEAGSADRLFIHTSRQRKHPVSRLDAKAHVGLGPEIGYRRSRARAKLELFRDLDGERATRAQGMGHDRAFREAGRICIQEPAGLLAAQGAHGEQYVVVRKQMAAEHGRRHAFVKSKCMGQLPGSIEQPHRIPKIIKHGTQPQRESARECFDVLQVGTWYSSSWAVGHGLHGDFMSAGFWLYDSDYRQKMEICSWRR